MGLDELYIGGPPELQHRVADVVYVTRAGRAARRLGRGDAGVDRRFNRPWRGRPRAPGGGGVASAASLALFYQPLINGGVTASGTRIMKHETIEFATPSARRRTTSIRPRAHSEPRAERRRRGRRWQRLHARLRAYVFAAGCRPRRRRRPDRLGRPGNRDLARLLHQRLCRRVTMGRRLTAIGSLAEILRILNGGRLIRRSRARTAPRAR